MRLIVVVRRTPQQRQLDAITGGVVVVERHLDRGTLELAALLPLHLLRVERP